MRFLTLFVRMPSIGTYVRSLIRDIGYKLDTVATTTLLERTKQGKFTLQDCLAKPDWTADMIYEKLNHFNQMRQAEGNGLSTE